ncbi:hypothetical protein AMECASPLE_037059 [Ameca splendens]|uniref:Uncharacterized protein n=1 Tax=Ameca splendens TaxID=208324 RepID=A0ABV0Y7V0_9TELE
MTERADQKNSEAQLRTAVFHQGILLGKHQATLQSLSQQQTDIQQTVNLMAQQLQAVFSSLSANSAPSALPPAPAPPTPVQSRAVSREILPPPLEPFSGDLSKSRGFLLQCTLVFHRSPMLFS